MKWNLSYFSYINRILITILIRDFKQPYGSGCLSLAYCWDEQTIEEDDEYVFPNISELEKDTGISVTVGLEHIWM